MDKSAYRPGQKSAHNIVIDRLAEGKSYTAIVLPTRYGKSDVMRMSALDAKDRGLVCTTLALSPSQYLRNQLVDVEKLREMQVRYSVNQSLQVDTLKNWRMNIGANDEFLVSSTTQLVQEYLPQLCEWIRHMRFKTGIPPLITVDECHTGSESNKWGAITQRAQAAGAYVNLYTATEYRSDGERIPGFKWEEFDAEDKVIYDVRPGSTPKTIRVDVWEAVKGKIKLIPHHKTSFREAWAEDPSPLCKIDHLPFDVNLERVDGVDGEVKLLSQLSQTDERMYLGTVIRDSQSIREGCQKGIRVLNKLRSITSDIQMGFFVGNDLESESQTNKHAHAVKRILKEIDPSLNVVIITSKDSKTGQANEKALSDLKEFATGRKYDVAIFKQMASQGIDAPRWKVIVDLSPTRTPNSVIQRLMRAATPHGTHRVMYYIHPADQSLQGIWKNFIADEGGMVRVDKENLIESYELPKKEPSDRDQYRVNGTVHADFDDSDFNEAEAGLYDDTADFLKVFPELLSRLSHAEIANRINEWGNLVSQTSMSVENTEVSRVGLRSDINDRADDITNADMKKFGYSYPRNPEKWVEIRKGVFVHVWRKLNIPSSTKLGDISEVLLLEKIKAEMETLYYGHA